MKDIEKIRHSLAHLMAAAVLELYPNTKHTIGPVIENGFYYDFDLPEPITKKDLEKIEKKMREILKTWDKIEGKEVDIKEAKEFFKDNEYKLELIKDLEEAGEKISFYTSGKFTDLCRGGHVNNMSKVPLDSWKLDRIAGAYWLGSEQNKMLTRIYGLAFENKKELDEYIKNREEAKKRDHRKLGKDLDLFHIDEIVGAGLPLWHPKGALLWRIIEDFWYAEHLKNGYNLVRTPHIGNRVLWETSGHWGFYNSSMYPPMEVGQTLEERQQGKQAEVSEEYLLKPMNCPFHVQIYKNEPKSYRDLPMRWAECGTVYRYEKKGELSGLTRVRGFTQDDAHIICSKDQVEEELGKVVDFILFIYKSFGFDIKDVNVYLSVRDPKVDKYAGDDKGWKFTENILEKVAKEKGLNYQKDIGGAVFYGPKLDFKVKDVLGREWQCSTLQFDFNIPERFKMVFINSKGQEERPYMLHRALFGSFERFIGLLIEHYAGAFPFWLSPVQVKVLPIGEDHFKYAEKILKKLRENNIRAEIDELNESLGKKIREVKTQKIPYYLVIGDNEIKSDEVTVESRTEKLGAMSLDKFLELLNKEIKEKK
ncbi:MAG: threonine--tRNA ligase [Candidatus Zambryskibacteria bacterium]|nr:threonine--tRNA ligase [Candidatus Zambryskibacteria bacterium]